MLYNKNRGQKQGETKPVYTLNFPFNTSDIFTKPLDVGDFEKHRMKLGIWEAPITSQ